MPNEKPDDEKLVFKTEQYITALYCILQSMGVIIIKADAFKDLSNCKDKIIVEYNADKNAYRLRVRPIKRKKGIIKPYRKIIDNAK